jgi:hypothetical protein
MGSSLSAADLVGVAEPFLLIFDKGQGLRRIFALGAEEPDPAANRDLVFA